MQRHHRRHHCICRIVGIRKIVFFIHVVYDAMIDDKSTPHSASESFVWIMACNEYDNYDLCTYHFRIIIKLLALLASIWCLTFVILPLARECVPAHDMDRCISPEDIIHFYLSSSSSLALWLWRRNWLFFVCRLPLLLLLWLIFLKSFLSSNYQNAYTHSLTRIHHSFSRSINSLPTANDGVVFSLHFITTIIAFR